MLPGAKRRQGRDDYVSIWQRFIDRIFDAPFGKIDPTDQAAAEARGQSAIVQIHVAQEEERRKARRGKNWEYVGDRLHLDGFPITIRRATAEEVRNRGGIFCVECDSLMPNFAWTLEDAQFVGERWAREIDALPLAQKEGQAEGNGTDFKQGMKFQDCSVIQCIAVEDIGLIMVDTKVLRRIKDAGLTPGLAVEQGMATVEHSTLRLNGDVPLPGEGSSVKTEVDEMTDFENAVAIVYNEAVALLWKAIEEGQLDAGKAEMALCDALERTWPDAVSKAREDTGDRGNDSPPRTPQ